MDLRRVAGRCQRPAAFGVRERLLAVAASSGADPATWGWRQDPDGGLSTPLVGLDQDDVGHGRFAVGVPAAEGRLAVSRWRDWGDRCPCSANRSLSLRRRLGSIGLAVAGRVVFGTAVGGQM
jgi:hypothetical protein